MTGKTEPELGDVQKTLFLPLWGRATETQRAHPLLVDRAAVEIVEKVRYDFPTIARNMHPVTRFAWIVRSLLIDRVVREFLTRHPRGTIVNIGCGLDTTFERVDNGQCRWVDLDLPDVIALRRKFVKPGPRRVFMARSFLDDSWLRKVDAHSGLLFVAAGVFYYFDASDVRRFFRSVADAFEECELVFDAASPLGVKMSNKVVIEKSGLDQRSFLKWGLEHTRDILEWDPRIALVKQYAYFKGMKRHLALKDRYAALMSDLLRIQYLIHVRILND